MIGIIGDLHREDESMSFPKLFYTTFYIAKTNEK